MNYNFPIIKSIEDVLPAIEGRDEFIVAERDGFTVINYNVGFEDTFTIDPAQPELGIMRRECRGLIFWPDGRVMSRPFHKFFNVGEREETQLHNVDLTFMTHTIMEKMDGSMIRPMIVNGQLRLGTKMGVTDTSIEAEKVLDAMPNADEVCDFLEGLVYDGVTPLFEFVSPDNRIVLKYEQPALVLLALRSNYDGVYMDYIGRKGAKLKGMFPTAPEYGSVDGSFEDYIARQREAEGREGDIIRFSNGHMLKIKNDWYVRIHKVKDKIRSDRHVLALLLANDLDDVYPHLDKDDYDRIKKFETDFHVSLNIKVCDIEWAARDAWLAANFSKKDLATNVLPKSGIDKDDWPIVFKYADGKTNFYELVMERVNRGLGNTVKYNEMAAWLGLAADKGEDE